MEAGRDDIGSPLAGSELPPAPGEPQGARLAGDQECRLEAGGQGGNDRSSGERTRGLDRHSALDFAGGMEGARVARPLRRPAAARLAGAPADWAKGSSSDAEKHRPAFATTRLSGC